MPALWEPQHEAQFQLDVFCNLPFSLATIDYQQTPTPAPSVRQKSIAERREREERARERERAGNLRAAASLARRAALEAKEGGDFSMRPDDVLAPRARQTALEHAQQFYGLGMLDGVPGSPARDAVSSAIRATMPHEGLDFLPPRSHTHAADAAASSATRTNAHPSHTNVHPSHTSTSPSTSTSTRANHDARGQTKTYERDTPWATERAVDHEVAAAALRERRDREREAERRLLAGLQPEPEPLPSSWNDGGAGGAGGAGGGGGGGSKGALTPSQAAAAAVADLSSASVSTHIGAARASMAATIKRDADALLFSLRMRFVDNAARMDGNSQGVGESAPF